MLLHNFPCRGFPSIYLHCYWGESCLLISSPLIGGKIYYSSRPRAIAVPQGITLASPLGLRTMSAHTEEVGMRY